MTYMFDPSNPIICLYTCWRFVIYSRGATWDAFGGRFFVFWDCCFCFGVAICDLVRALSFSGVDSVWIFFSEV